MPVVSTLYILRRNFLFGNHAIFVAIVVNDKLLAIAAVVVERHIGMYLLLRHMARGSLHRERHHGRGHSYPQDMDKEITFYRKPTLYPKIFY